MKTPEMDLKTGLPIITNENSTVTAHELRQRNPKRTITDSTVMVKVFNRSPGVYKHGVKELVDGEDEKGNAIKVLEVTHTIVVPPGGSGVVPENIAAIWKSISNGLVLPEEEANAAAEANRTALEKATAENTELTSALEAAEARQADLEAQLAALRAKPSKAETRAPVPAEQSGGE